MEKQYTIPKIYSAKGDLKKRWYVYYSFRHPATGIMTRQATLTMGINRRFKTVKGRMEQFKILQKATLQALKDGFNPYDEKIRNENYYPIDECFNKVLETKKKTLKESSFVDYQKRSRYFLNYLEEKGWSNIDVRKINREMINDYLDITLQRTSPRNRNNNKTVLSAIFTELLDSGIIENNILESIKQLKTHSKRDATISMEDLDLLEKKMQKDKELLLFIHCIGYLFLRPVEVVRLEIEHINLQEKTVSVEIKQKDYKTKIIPQLILKELSDFIGLRKDGFLFERKNDAVSEVSKRNALAKKFRKTRDTLNLSKDYTVYSFRHTYITKVYKELRKEFNQEESLSKLRLITGHSSDAIHKYIHYIDAELPKDYSDLLK